ncbi:MAG TPA: HAMP domain-containing sensor histidine kinase [Candidatus Nitrosocosmicus sp.]|nr:HAMP domain-containing sensor histidine kinase [Candidatus Nitrosocosmicus sp.]
MYPKSKIKIIASLLFTFILLAAIIVILSTNIANDILKDRIESQFLSESSSRGEAIRLLMGIYINQVKHLSDRLSIDNEIREILVSNGQVEHRLSDDGGYTNSTLLEQKVAQYGVALDNATNIKDMKIVNEKGEILLSLNPEGTWRNASSSKPYTENTNSFSNKLTSNSVPFVELEKVKNEKRQLISIIVPFVINQDIESQSSTLNQKENNDHRLFFSVSIDTDSFNKILLNRKGLGQSGEVYLVNSSKMMASESRFFNNASTIAVDTLPVRKCFDSANGGDERGIYNDYRNIPIFGFSYCAKDLGFVLLAEIDRAEVLQPIDNLRNTILIISITSGLVLIAVSVVVIFTLLSWNKKLASANIQLQEKDKMQIEFINIAAHELRTPLQPILVLSELLIQGIKDSEQIHLLNIISRNAKKLKKLSDNILDITKIESNTLNLNKEQFSLDELIQNIIKDFENHLNHKQIKFEYNNLVTNCTLYADKDRISQVLLNLIGNSVKFIDGEGTITVTVEKKKGDNSSQINSKTKNNEMIFITVKDNGKGIDKEIMPKLFTKFVTKSFQGTGLGLYISKKIMEAHGGSLSAENNLDGKGATFCFSLPLMFHE